MRKNNLGDNTLWIIGSLIISSFIAPIVIWQYQQSKVDDAQKTIHEQKIELETNDQIIILYEKMNRLNTEQRSLAYKLAASDDLSESSVIRVTRTANRKELDVIEEMISKLTGKSIERIHTISEPMPPTFSAQ